MIFLIRKKEKKSQEEIEIIESHPSRSIHSTELYLNSQTKVSNEQKILNVVFIILYVILGLGTLISYIYSFGISFGTFYPYRHLTFPLFLATMITLDLALLTSYSDEPIKIGGIS